MEKMLGAMEELYPVFTPSCVVHEISDFSDEFLLYYYYVKPKEEYFY